MAQAHVLTVRELNAKERASGVFGPFGAVIPPLKGEARAEVPMYLEPGSAKGENSLARLLVSPFRLGAEVAAHIERHPFSSQIFTPLGDTPLVSIVARSQIAKPTPYDLRAFLIPPRHIVVYRPGVWHLGMMSDGEAVEVLVFVRRLPNGRDTERRDLEAMIKLGCMEVM